MRSGGEGTMKLLHRREHGQVPHPLERWMIMSRRRRMMRKKKAGVQLQGQARECRKDKSR
jgi:hypothetical protein